MNNNDSLEEAIQFSKKFLENILSFFGLNTDVHATNEDNEVIELNVPSSNINGFLIGQHGETARALQYIISNSLRSNGFTHCRVNLDVADYKKHHAESITKQAEKWFKEVKESQTPKSLEPMNSADRRTVHKAAEDYGLTTTSEGEGRSRHIVIKPAD